MSAEFPLAVKTFQNPLATNKLSNPSHAKQHSDLNDEVHAVQDLLAEIYFDVTAYGATGNGTTDDTVAIQDAIAAQYAAGHGIVWFPAGNYKVTDTLMIHDGAVLKGMNEWMYNSTYDKTYSKITFAPTSEKDLFDVTDVITGHSGYMWKVYIGGLYLSGNTTGAVTYSRYAINTKSAQSIYENLGIFQFQTGIYCNGTMQNKYQNIVIRNMSVSGISTSASGNTTDIFDTVWVDSSPWGAILVQSTDFRFINCLWESLTTGGVNLYRGTTTEFISNYAEEVPNSSAGDNYGMFYIAHDGTVSNTSCSIIGGVYGGSGSPYHGSFIDADYLEITQNASIYVSPAYVTRYVNGIKVSATNTGRYTVHCAAFAHSSVNNLLVNNDPSSNGQVAIFGWIPSVGTPAASYLLSPTAQLKGLQLANSNGESHVHLDGWSFTLNDAGTKLMNFDVGDVSALIISASDGISLNESGVFSCFCDSVSTVSIAKTAGTTNTDIVNSAGKLCFYPHTATSGYSVIRNNLGALVTVKVLRMK
jgi:hypothetical protein